MANKYEFELGEIDDELVDEYKDMKKRMNLFDLEVKLTEEWEKWMGFTLKKGMVYGKIRGHYVVVTNPSYAWSNGRIETFIFRDGDWEHDYVTPEFYDGALVKVEGLLHDFLEFWQWKNKNRKGMIDMKPSIKEMQERIYCEISETNGNINWISFYDTEEEYECQFDFTLEELEEVKTLVETRNHNEYDWRSWEDKVIANHYDEIEEIEEEEE